MKRALPAVFALLFLLLAAPVLGQEEEDPAASRAESFEAAEPGAQTEDVPGGALMVGAYGAVWVLVLGYVMAIGFRHAKTARELEQLREDIGAHGGDGD